MDGDNSGTLSKDEFVSRGIFRILGFGCIWVGFENNEEIGIKNGNSQVFGNWKNNDFEWCYMRFIVIMNLWIGDDSEKWRTEEIDLRNWWGISSFSNFLIRRIKCTKKAKRVRFNI